MELFMSNTMTTPLHVCHVIKEFTLLLQPFGLGHIMHIIMHYTCTMLQHTLSERGREEDRRKEQLRGSFWEGTIICDSEGGFRKGAVI